MTPTKTQLETTTIFEAQTRRIPDTKRLIRILDNLVDESPVRINEKGIRFRAADPSKVGMIDLVLEPDAFSNYQPPEKELYFQVNAEDLKDKVTEARKGDRLTFSVTHEQVQESREPVLHVSVRSDGVESTFSLPTTQVDEEDQPDTENLEFDGSAVVAMEKFTKAINRMDDSMQLTLTEDQLVLESSGDGESQSTRVTFPENSDHLHAVKLEDGRVRSLYSRDYLENIKQLKQVVKRATLSFSSDYPLRVEASNNWFQLEYTVAPRIEEN